MYTTIKSWKNRHLINENYNLKNLNNKLVEKLLALGFKKGHSGLENIHDSYYTEGEKFDIVIGLTGGEDYKLGEDSTLIVYIKNEDGGQDLELLGEDASNFLKNVEKNVENIRNSNSFEEITNEFSIN